jgi:hypothetical protein
MATLSLPNFLGPVNNYLQDFLNNFETQWGIFDANGDPLTGFTMSLVGAIQSTYSFTFDRENQVSSFPVERGGFATYNKVRMPATPSIVLNLTGSISDGTQFLNAIENACNSTQLYSVITPQVQYINYTIQKYNYSRTASQGATLLSVEIFLMEVIQVSVQTIPQTGGQNNSITNSNDPTAASSQSGGQVQPKAPSTQTTNAVNNSVGI